MPDVGIYEMLVRPSKKNWKIKVGVYKKVLTDERKYGSITVLCYRIFCYGDEENACIYAVHLTIAN